MPSIMTLDQLKGLTHAYDLFITVNESDLPEYYKQVFPDTCKCGAEIIMTSESDGSKYTQLQCCNPACWVKMAHRFAYFAKVLGFKGFGSAGALQLYQALYPQFKYPTFLNIFEMPIGAIRNVMGEAYGDYFYDMTRELHDTGYSFVDAIVSLGIPDIGRNSRLFDIVKSPTVLLDYVLKNRLGELCDIAGINAPKSRFALQMARLDIVTLMHEVMPHILKTPSHEVHVAITGAVTVGGKRLTRPEFIWLCESIKDANGEQVYKLVETKSEAKLEYVIADSVSTSSKYSIGKKLGVLVTANEFYNMLVQQASGGAASE